MTRADIIIAAIRQSAALGVRDISLELPASACAAIYARLDRQGGEPGRRSKGIYGFRCRWWHGDIRIGDRYIGVNLRTQYEEIEEIEQGDGYAMHDVAARDNASNKRRSA